MDTNAINTYKHPVLLFDGVCNLCNSSVQFIINKDPQGVFQFASLQSDIGKTLLEKYNLDAGAMDSVVLIRNDKAYTRSSAALQAVRILGGAWSLLYGFIIIPKFLRDAVYDWVARNRYKWFGKKDSCWLPTPDLKARFLD